MNQIPPIFSEKRDYQIKWQEESQQGAGMIAAMFGIPLILFSYDSLSGVTAQEVLDKIIPMAVINGQQINSSIYSDEKVVTGNDIYVYMRYREKGITGVKIAISPDVIKQIVPYYITYMEVKCGKKCVIVRENIDEEEAINKWHAFISRTLEAQQRFGYK